MPFLRFTRDKRGYEHTYLIHASTKKGAGARILYWYRTPPGVRVGRIAFDEEVRRALESQYPSIVFDWPALMETPAPPPDVEHWRERRRAEKAARQARQAEEREPDGEGDDHQQGDIGAGEPQARPAAVTAEGGLGAVPEVVTAPLAAGETAPGLVPDGASAQAGASEPHGEADGSGDGQSRDGQARTGRKRRRRGGRRRRKPGTGDAPPASDAAGTALVSELDAEAGGEDDEATGASDASSERGGEP